MKLEDSGLSDENDRITDSISYNVPLQHCENAENISPQVVRRKRLALAENRNSSESFRLSRAEAHHSFVEFAGVEEWDGSGEDLKWLGVKLEAENHRKTL